ncbi:MAG: hypothetical protein ABSG53_25190 [Thermoguttaceae bacterium]
MTKSDLRIRDREPVSRGPGLAGAAAGRRFRGDLRSVDGRGRETLAKRWGGFSGRFRRGGFGLLPPQAAGLVRVPAVVANQVRDLRRIMFGELSQQSQRFEERIASSTIAARRCSPSCRFVTLRVGKGPGGVLLRLVDHLPGAGRLDQPRQAEGTARHVPDQKLDARTVGGRQMHRLIEAESAHYRTQPRQIMSAAIEPT